MIKKNVGGIDTYIRIILGLIGVGFGFFYGHFWGNRYWSCAFLYGVVWMVWTLLADRNFNM